MADLSVSAGMARALLDYAVSRGASQPALLDRAGIAAAQLAEHDARVPFANYVALMRSSQQLCADPALALHFAEAVSLWDFSLVGLICIASETMMEAFYQCNRYGRLVIEVDLDDADRFALAREESGLWVVDRRKDANAFPELTETTFARTVVQPREFLPEPIVLELHVTHPAPSYRAEYDRIFRCPIVFESRRNAIRMNPAMMAHTVQQEPRFVFGVLCAHADALLKDLERTKTTRGRVESLPVLHKGDANIDAVVAKLGMSRQTLYRKLKAEGVTFEQVLDDLRRRMALDYLSNGKVTVNETAYLVGFSEAAAFSRAFKRWTGKSPSAAKHAATS